MSDTPVEVVVRDIDSDRHLDSINAGEPLPAPGDVLIYDVIYHGYIQYSVLHRQFDRYASRIVVWCRQVK